MLVPTNLSPFYPYPTNLSLFNPQIISSILFIVALVGTCILARRTYKVLAVVFAYYLITLLPVLGIFQVGDRPQLTVIHTFPVSGRFFSLD